uniref:C2H2-type domain-containing protein n=1 Tax=Anopheles farauti TaxID=69004 RepID=A0A3F2YX50_9DIPT
MTLETKFSRTTVFQLLERFTERELSDQATSLEESGVCGDCYTKLNDYDAAYTKSLIIQQELTDLLKNSPLQVNEELHAQAGEEYETEEKESGLNWVLEDTFPTTQATNNDGLSSIKISMKCNVCGVLFQNIKEMKLHTHRVENSDNMTIEVNTQKPSTSSSTLIIETVNPETELSIEHRENINELCLDNSNDAFCEEDETLADFLLADVKEERDSEGESNSEESVLSFECLYCDLKFTTKEQAKIHITLSHPKDAIAHVCKVCGLSTRTRAALVSHFGKHQRESHLVCMVCKKTFSQKAVLQRHMAIHTREKAYQCDVCGKQYIHYSSFYMHQLVHNDIREKKCTICGYMLRSNSHLKRHMRSHSGEKPFACPECGQKFSQRYNMVQHMRVHKGISRRSVKLLGCPDCDFVCEKHSQLKRHMQQHPNKDITTTECQN